MRLAAAIALAALLAGPTQALAQAAAETDVAAFYRLRAEGVAAANADDLTTASARLAEADERISNHPSLMLMRLRLAVAAGRHAEAMAMAQRYAATGLSMNLGGDPALGELRGQPGFEALAATVEENREPVGADRLAPLAAIPGGGLVESVVWDEQRGRWLASMVRDRTIVALDEAGATSPFLQPDGEIGGVLGLAMDPAAGVLWAASAPLPPAAQGRPGDAPPVASALLKIDAASGRVLARHPAPAGRMLGDVTLGPDGTVYVAGEDLFRLRPGRDGLEVLLPAGQMRSPQGMAVTPDGAALIVADYSSGLWRVDRASGAAIRLPAPSSASLIGLDGLITDGRVLYSLQNGTAPQRVLKLVPDAAWSRIEAVEVLAANLPQIDEPTTGLVHDGELVFVSRSQWSDFDGEGALRTPAPKPALISRLRLD